MAKLHDQLANCFLFSSFKKKLFSLWSTQTQ